MWISSRRRLLPSCRCRKGGGSRSAPSGRAVAACGSSRAAEESWWVDLPAGPRRVRSLPRRRTGGVEILLTDPEGSPVDGVAVHLLRPEAMLQNAPPPGYPARPRRDSWSRERSERGRVAWAGLPDRETLSVLVQPGGELMETTLRGLPSELPATVHLATRCPRLSAGWWTKRGGPWRECGSVSRAGWPRTGSSPAPGGRAGPTGGGSSPGVRPAPAVLVLAPPAAGPSPHGQVKLRAGANDLRPPTTLAPGVALTVRLVGDDALAGGRRDGPVRPPRRSPERRRRPGAPGGVAVGTTRSTGNADRHLEGERAATRPSRRLSSSPCRGAFTIEGGSSAATGKPLAGAWLKIVEGSHSLHPTVEESGRFLLRSVPRREGAPRGGARGSVGESVGRSCPVRRGSGGTWAISSSAAVSR